MGAGGSGGGRSPVEAPNSLQSKNILRLIDVLSEGPIEGPVQGLQSVFFNKTPFQNTEGGFNFRGATVDYRLGLPDQTPLPGFPAVEQEVSVGVEVTTLSPLVRSVVSPEADSVRLKMRIPSLSFLDTSTGDTGPTAVSFQIEVQESGGPWSPALLNYSWADIGAANTLAINNSRGFRITLRRFLQREYSAAFAAANGYQFPPPGQLLLSANYTVNGGAPIALTRAIDGVFAGRTESVNGNNWIVTYQYIWEFVVAEEVESNYAITAEFGDIIAAKRLEPTPVTIYGKTTSPYEEQYLIPLPRQYGGSPWNIRITRLTPDSTSQSLNNKLVWSTYTVINDAKMMYMDTAVVGVTVDAEQFGSSVPDRSYEIKGLQIQVPANYDPITRQYTGIWDGTFKTAWTDNPAWVAYALITNDRWGLGQYLDGTKVDKWSLYNIAKYCDELVPGADGTLEPRYTCNAVINRQQEAISVINAVVSIFHGMLYWGAGTLMFGADMPGTPVKVVTPANVIDGQFNYSGSDEMVRHSVALVTWNNPEKNYEQDIAVVEDPDAIRRYGWNPTDVVAYGCTKLGQATRHGRWILDTEKFQYETVTYRCGIDHADLLPNDLIAIHDPSYQGVRTGGRMLTYGGNLNGTGSAYIKMDAPYNFSSTQTYTVTVVMPDGSVRTRQGVPSTPTGTTTYGNQQFFKLTTPLTTPQTGETASTTPPNPGAMFGLTSSSLLPRQFRVIGMREVDVLTYEVSAVYHDPNKYARIDRQINSAAGNYSALPRGGIGAVTNITAQEYLYLVAGVVKSAVTVSWQPSSDPRVSRYRVEVKRPNATEYETLATVSSPSVDLQDTQFGTYSFRVQAQSSYISNVGSYGASSEATFSLLGLQAPPSDVTGFTSTLLEGTLFLTWNAVPDLDLSYYEIRFSQDVAATWDEALVITSNIPKGINSQTVPARNGKFFIKAFDLGGVPSNNAATVTNNNVGVGSLNVVETITEHPTFAGVKDNTTVEDDGLELVFGELWDSAENIDSTEPVDGTTDAITNLIGTYEFDNSIDLTEVYVSRVSINAVNTFVNKNDLWDDDNDLVDSNIDTVDSTVPSSAVDLLYQYATDSTLGAGTPTWSDWITFPRTGVVDIQARRLKFRVYMRTYDPYVTPRVEQLSVTIDMPDRVDSDKGLLTLTSGDLVVTFPTAFKDAPAVNVTLQNLQTGDYHEISNITRTGFTISAKNIAGTRVIRTFDYIAKGYGRAVS